MLTLCGHFLRDLRDQALEIFERIDYQPGIAEVLYMKAEGVQYSRDIGRNYTNQTEKNVAELRMCEISVGISWILCLF